MASVFGHVLPINNRNLYARPGQGIGGHITTGYIRAEKHRQTQCCCQALSPMSNIGLEQIRKDD